MESLDPVKRILELRNQSNLASLLKNATVDFDISTNFGSLLFSQLTTAEIHAPYENYERLKALSRKDKEAIKNAILEIWPPRAHGMEITLVVFRLNPTSLDEETDKPTELLQEIERQRSMMISVATGGPKIDTVNHEYQERYHRINASLRDLKIKNPNPYKDLWEWYGKWSSGDLPSYQSRREYIRGLFSSLEQRLCREKQGRVAEIFEELTGWPRVDRAVDEARRQLEQASTEEQFQAVGLTCREAMISLSQTVYRQEKHLPADGIIPSETDAKRMLDAYLSMEMSGHSNEIARRHAKAALDLANQLQHRRTASFREAALCAEATAAVINIIAILSGQRDP